LSHERCGIGSVRATPGSGSRPRVVGVAVSIAVACSVAACGFLNPNPNPTPESGTRKWIISVENLSRQPAALFVAADDLAMGRAVGTAVPSVVPAGVTQDVVFTVPSGQGRWAIFVNPGPERGPLILSQDVPAGRTGALPILIQIARDGSPNVSSPGAGPGWFGN
jgi:hypothetical protein